MDRRGGHPAVEAFFFWGFMGSAVETDAAGCVRFRGFYGDYALRGRLPDR